MPPLNILVADDEQDMREWFQKIVPLLGHKVIDAVATGRQLVAAARDSRPDLIITDIKMPDMDGIDAAEQLYRDYPVPVILVSAYHESDLIARAESDHVMAYLVKPIKQADLEPAIVLAMRRFDQFQQLQREANDLRQALADRKVIERAKGIIMKRAQIDEQEAFRRLQKLASEKNKKLIDLATMIVTAEEALG